MTHPSHTDRHRPEQQFARFMHWSVSKQWNSVWYRPLHAL